MKDWKSDLLAIKVQSPAQDEKIQTARKIEAKPATAQASFIKPLEIEKKNIGDYPKDRGTHNFPI